jgi:hypothetical protein
MQLHRDSGDVVERGKGSFIFPISVGARRVPCTVTRDALAIFVSDYDDPRRAFSQSRRMIERIAREKFAAVRMRYGIATSRIHAPMNGILPTFIGITRKMRARTPEATAPDNDMMTRSHQGACAQVRCVTLHPR